MAQPTTLTDTGSAALERVLGGYVERGEVDGLAWAVAVGDDETAGAAGAARRDSIFRIASMTKPVTAAATMALLERCELRIDDAVDRWLPELADRQVMAKPEGPLTETVPAVRPISVRDLLTFRLGYGMDFDFSKPQPLLEKFAELGLGAGPPEPQVAPAPDEFLRLLGSLPLSHQPGEKWLYNTGSDVLGLLLSRATGRSLESLFQDLVLDPLGLEDTAFSVPAAKLDRFGPCWTVVPGTGEKVVWDAADGQWSRPPVIELGGAGLVSTVDDFLTFARMLLGAGSHGGRRVLSPSSVAAMTTDQLAGIDGPSADGAIGWGFGVGVHRRRIDHTVAPGSYGWTGGLGSSWFNDPTNGVCAVLLTTQMFTSPALPTVHQDFTTTLYAHLA